MPDILLWTSSAIIIVVAVLGYRWLWELERRLDRLADRVSHLEGKKDV